MTVHGAPNLVVFIFVIIRAEGHIPYTVAYIVACCIEILNTCPHSLVPDMRVPFLGGA